jgi:hypothetical protein
MNTNKLYKIDFNGSTYTYNLHDNYELHNNQLTYFHEVIISTPSGKEIHEEIDFISMDKMSKDVFKKWVEIGMPDRNEYALTVQSTDDTINLTPLNRDMIDELYKIYKKDLKGN